MFPLKPGSAPPFRVTFATDRSYPPVLDIAAKDVELRTVAQVAEQNAWTISRYAKVAGAIAAALVLAFGIFAFGAITMMREVAKHILGMIAREAGTDRRREIGAQLMPRRSRSVPALITQRRRICCVLNTQVRKVG